MPRPKKIDTSEIDAAKQVVDKITSKLKRSCYKVFAEYNIPTLILTDRLNVYERTVVALHSEVIAILNGDSELAFGIALQDDAINDFFLWTCYANDELDSRGIPDHDQQELVEDLEVAFSGLNRAIQAQIEDWPDPDIQFLLAVRDKKLHASVDKHSNEWKEP